MTRSSWSDASTWTGDGLRREVFFFRSGDVQLYGSLYAAAEPLRPFGLVACHSWGVEADRSEPLVRSVALAMARLGGAALVFHYPGYGDSYGDLATIGLGEMSEAASDALAEAARRLPERAWILAGFMLGASVACRAGSRAAVEALLLVQPALRPTAYFERLAARTQPLAPGPSPQEMMSASTIPGMAYGYPLPARIDADADAAVNAALAVFGGTGAVVSQESSSGRDRAPERFERVEASGRWRFGAQNHPELAAATAGWLDRYTRQGGAPDGA